MRLNGEVETKGIRGLRMCFPVYREEWTAPDEPSVREVEVPVFWMVQDGELVGWMLEYEGELWDRESLRARLAEE